MSEPAFEQIELSPALPRKGRRLFRAFLALVFSLVAPGLGQIYARQPYRGLLFGAVYLLALFLQGAFGTLKTPTGFAVFVCWSIGVGLLIVIDSARLGWKKGNETQPPSPKLAAWGAAIVLLVFSAVRASDWYAIRYFHIKAFKVPSMSMCPTVCEGDRVIVDTTAFKIHPPTRGDVIIFTPLTGGAPFIKRVIGVAGDVVKPSPGKMILVDGVALPRPQVCGNLRSCRSSRKPSTSRRQLSQVVRSLLWAITLVTVSTAELRDSVLQNPNRSLVNHSSCIGRSTQSGSDVKSVRAAALSTKTV